MSIMGSIYTNPSELGSDYWKERAETYLHDQELYQKECDTIRKQSDVAMKALEKYSFLKNWNEYTYYDGEYAGSKLAEIALTEIKRIRGKNE